MLVFGVGSSPKSSHSASHSAGNGANKDREPTLVAWKTGTKIQKNLCTVEDGSHRKIVLFEMGALLD